MRLPAIIIGGTKASRDRKRAELEAGLYGQAWSATGRALQDVAGWAKNNAPWLLPIVTFGLGGPVAAYIGHRTGKVVKRNGSAKELGLEVLQAWADAALIGALLSGNAPAAAAAGAARSSAYGDGYGAGSHARTLADSVTPEDMAAAAEWARQQGLDPENEKHTAAIAQAMRAAADAVAPTTSAAAPGQQQSNVFRFDGGATQATAGGHVYRF